jgi:hypothetical protein
MQTCPLLKQFEARQSGLIRTPAPLSSRLPFERNWPPKFSYGAVRSARDFLLLSLTSRESNSDNGRRSLHEAVHGNAGAVPVGDGSRGRSVVGPRRASELSNRACVPWLRRGGCRRISLKIFADRSYWSRCSSYRVSPVDPSPLFVANAQPPHDLIRRRGAAIHPRSSGHCRPSGSGLSTKSPRPWSPREQRGSLPPDQPDSPRHAAAAGVATFCPVELEPPPHMRCRITAACGRLTRVLAATGWDGR